MFWQGIPPTSKLYSEPGELMNYKAFLCLFHRPRSSGDMSTVLVKVKQFWKRMNRTVEETSETGGAFMEVCFCRRVCIRRMTGVCMYRVFNLHV